jgi:hypothetical protein
MKTVRIGTWSWPFEAYSRALKHQDGNGGLWHADDRSVRFVIDSATHEIAPVWGHRPDLRPTLSGQRVLGLFHPLDVLATRLVAVPTFNGTTAVSSDATFAWLREHFTGIKTYEVHVDDASSREPAELIAVGDPMSAAIARRAGLLASNATWLRDPWLYQVDGKHLYGLGGLSWDVLAAARLITCGVERVSPAFPGWTTEQREAAESALVPLVQAAAVTFSIREVRAENLAED